MIFYDKITLGFSHSIIIGHLPENLKLELIGNTNESHSKSKVDIEKFGLFDTAAPNFHTYYPGVSAADLKPKEGDFVKPVFRLLSKTIVHKQTNPIDFSKDNVLKDSMPKLLGQTLYANHEAMVGNELGVVSGVNWQDGYTTQDGLHIPGGINGELKIDAKSHPNIARSVMSEPPAIHSNSVTVQFGWEKSHPSLSTDDFWSKLGKLGDDKQLVRRIVTHIPSYHETSFVAHGADVYAQKVDKNGVIVNPEYADSQYSLSAQGKEKPKYYFFSYKDDITSLSDNSIPLNNNNINPEEMKDLIKQLAAKYNKPEAEITEAFILDLFANHELSLTELATAKTNLTTAQADVTRLTTELSTEKSNVTSLTTEKGTLTAEVTNLKAEVEKLKPLSSVYIDKLRKDTKKMYSVLKADKADATKLASYDTADITTLEIDHKEYLADVETKFPATCKDCGSKNVGRNSAQLGDGENPDPTSKTEAQINEEIRKEAKKGYIFDKSK